MARALKVWAVVLLLTVAATALVVAAWMLLMTVAPPVPAIMFAVAFAVLLSVPLGRVVNWLTKG